MEHNSIVNRYLSDNDRYADLINGCSFAGEQVIAATDLSDVDSQVNETFRIATNHRNGTTGKTKYRDLIRKVAFGINFAVIGIENQEKVHYLMPLRAMEYDVKEYRRQAGIIRKRVKNNKNINTNINQRCFKP